MDQRLIKFCEALDDAKLALPVHMQRADHVQVDRADRILLHVFEHQIHHRGQVHAMLAGTNVAPPQLDEFFADGDAAFHAEDFAELGWREDEVWRGLERAEQKGRCFRTGPVRQVISEKFARLITQAATACAAGASRMPSSRPIWVRISTTCCSCSVPNARPKPSSGAGRYRTASPAAAPN